MVEEYIDGIKQADEEFIENYRKGRERFGVWWTVLYASMLSMFLVFLTTAIILIIMFT